MNYKIKKANSILEVIKRNFKYTDNFTFVTFDKSFIKNHREYAKQYMKPE